MKESSAEYPGRRSESAKSSAGVGYRFAMGKPSAGRGMRYNSVSFEENTLRDNILNNNGTCTACPDKQD